MARRKNTNQLSLSFMEEPSAPDPWVAWAQRPRTLENRLADHTLQIKRDLAVLNGPPQYCVDRAFYEERVAGHRAIAQQLMEQLSATA